MMHLWSAKLAWPSPHLRWCEALQRHVDLVEIKGLRIKLTPYPFEHLLVLGVLWSVDGFQETGVAPDATTILGGTGPFAREADGVALPLVQRQYLFNEELVFPAIPKIVLIEQLGLLAPHQGRQAHGTRVFRIPLAHHARITIGDATTNKLIQVRALPPHHALASNALTNEAAVIRCHCLAHGRRKFSDLAEVFPHECQVVLEVMSQVFDHDEQARKEQLSPAARLAYHQAQSQPLLDGLKRWLDTQIDAHLVEP